MTEQDYLELFELQQIIKEGVEEAVPGAVRVRAEVASVQQRTNGHCYLKACSAVKTTPALPLKPSVPKYFPMQ